MKKLNNLLFKASGVLALLLLSFNTQAQVRFGDNLGNHTATTDLNMSTKNINGVGAVQYNTLDLTATVITAGNYIAAAGGSATTSPTTTVDIYSAIKVAVTAANTNIKLSSPTVTTAGRVVYIINGGTVPLVLSTTSSTIAAGQSLCLIWNGTAWVENDGTKLVPFNSLTNATGTNSIDNTTFAQTWAWSSATTTSPLTLSGAALTTGNLLTLTGPSTLTTGSVINATAAVAAGTSGGILTVKNTAASSAGTVATIQANSTAGSGLTVLGTGNVGVGTAAPVATLHNAGSTVLGMYANAPSTATYLPANTASVDIYSGVVLTPTVDCAVTIPNPTAAAAGRIFTIINSAASTKVVTIANASTPVTLSAGKQVQLVWDGASWLGKTANGGKASVAVPAGTSTLLDNATVNGGSTNVMVAVDLAVSGVSVGDAVSVSFDGNDCTTAAGKWLNVANQGIVIMNSYAKTAGTVTVTLANVKSGSTPSFDGAKLTVNYTH